MMVLPSCPKCEGTLRSIADDSAQCRCGFTIDGWALAGAVSRSSSATAIRERMLAAGRMVSPPDAKPGIRISETYAELAAVRWDSRLEKPTPGLPAARLRAAAIEQGAKNGLRFQHDEARGAYLVVPMPDGTRRNLERNNLYALAPIGREVEAARQMVDVIATKCGPGRWWSLLDPVHRIADDGMIKVADVGGAPHVFLRALYCHLPTCPLCGEPCDRAKVNGVKVNGCECVGERTFAVSYGRKNAALPPGSLGNIVKYKGEPPSGGWEREVNGVWRSCNRLGFPTSGESWPSGSIVGAVRYKAVQQAARPTAHVTGVKYEPIAIDKATLDAAAKTPSLVDFVQRETDRALSEMYAERDRMLKHAFESQGIPPSVLGTAAGRHEAVLRLAQYGAITAEQARELLEMPAVEPPRPLWDGLTLDVCYERWQENRLDVESGKPPRHPLTIEQARAARTVYQERFGAVDTARLRRKVEASKECERQRVVVDLEVD